MLLLLGTAQVSGATWFVDGAAAPAGDGRSWATAFKEIWRGINAATHGDTVLVAQGTYVGQVQFLGKNITLSSRNPADPAVVAATKLDGNNSGSVVVFGGTEGSNCVLSGFTIQRGYAGLSGGGILGGSSSNRTRATIQQNLITANRAPTYGGGIAYCDGSIRGNTISVCTANNGGGLAYCGGAIQNNLIQVNAAEYGGGGLFSCNGLIHGNRVFGNSAVYGGGLVYCDGVVRSNTVVLNRASEGAGLRMCQGPIERNRVLGNVATNSGGGLAGCNGTNLSNVIAGNSARNGGGLAGCNGALLNNTIVYNTATDAGRGLFSCGGTIANCIIWGSTGSTNPALANSSLPTNCCIQNWTGGGWGNITNDPLFMDANGPDNNSSTYEDNDYRLGPESPCIDGGANQFLNPPGLDQDGNLRIVRWRFVVMPYVDMGAYEYGARRFAVTWAGFSSWPPPGGRSLTWNSQPRDTYGLWVRSSLGSDGWVKLKSVSSQGETTTGTDSGLLPFGWRARFYRVEME